MRLLLNAAQQRFLAGRQIARALVQPFMHQRGGGLFVFRFLRVLENGHRIAIAVAEANLPPGVDTQTDLDRLNAMPVSLFE